MFEAYFNRFGFKQPSVNQAVSQDLQAVVVLPAHKEQTLLPTIKSLINAGLRDLNIELIVVFNAAVQDQTAEQVNRYSKKELEDFTHEEQLRDRVFLLDEKLPKKHAGVGLARKIGMDEAAFRLEQANNLDAPIICFDADSQCERNYLQSILSHFRAHSSIASCSIHYEHPIEGSEFKEEIYEGIAAYELHLRYYVLGLAYAGMPFAYHTIGSSMAVRAIDYMKQGGMNKRKAGEDFYFLQKFIALGKHNNLTETKVIPSPRASDRVPFGTGRAIKEMQEGSRDIHLSYAWEAFQCLKRSFTGIEEWYKGTYRFESSLLSFMDEQVLIDYIRRAQKKSGDFKQFSLEFFKQFNAFTCLKYMHFLRDNYYPNEELDKSVPFLLANYGIKTKGEDIGGLLMLCRALEQKHQF